MRVSQINYNNYLPNNLCRNDNGKALATSFKGLWGKEEQYYVPGIEGAGYSCDHFYETKHYYPFLDESHSAIASIKSQYPQYEACDYSTATPEAGYEREVKLKLEKSLPFTEAEWEQYSKNKFSLARNTRQFIEESLKRFNLKQYLVK